MQFLSVLHAICWRCYIWSLQWEKERESSYVGSQPSSTNPLWVKVYMSSLFTYLNWTSIFYRFVVRGGSKKKISQKHTRVKKLFGLPTENMITTLGSIVSIVVWWAMYMFDKHFCKFFSFDMQNLHKNEMHVNWHIRNWNDMYY